MSELTGPRVRVVVLGVALIAGVAIVALRSQKRPTTGVSTSVAPANEVASPTSAMLTAETVALTLKPEQLQARVRTALNAHVVELHKCVPDGGTAALTFNYTFAADGRQLGRGVAEDRQRQAPEVTACILRRLAPLEVGPIGRRMQTTVRLEL